MSFKALREGPVVSWYSPSTSRKLLLAVAGLSMSGSCKSRDPYQDMVQGTIAYPFYEQARPLGKNGSGDHFVIKATNGGTEYSVEIPAAADYDVEVPLGEMGGDSSTAPRGPKGSNAVPNPQLTDRELVAHMPQLPRDTEADRALLDKAFGVGELGGPQQSPSYTLGLARINEFYQKHQFEYALVEINNLLTYYPTSIKLHKMKGTVLIKLSSLALAERAWLRAAELAPDDPVVKKGLERLRRKMDLERKVSGQLVNPPPAAPPSAQELPQQPTPQSLQRDNRDLDQRQ